MAPLTVSRADGVALLTLNRPAKRNALSIELRERLMEELAALARDDDVRCAVLTGAGTAFCSGMDRDEFGGERAHRERLVEVSVGAFAAVGTFPKPSAWCVERPGRGGRLRARIAVRPAPGGAGGEHGVPRGGAARGSRPPSRPPGRRCPRRWRASCA